MIRKILLAVGAASAARYSAEDLDQDMVNAQAVTDAQQTLSDAIQKTSEVYKTADEVIAAITNLMEVDPVFAVTGFITAFGKIFSFFFQYKHIIK